MSKSKYDLLRSQYPKYISKDQLRRICEISPLSASYLINNRIIPVIDTGKQTWRYKISLEDVISYLMKKEKYGSMIPKGAVTSTDKNVKKSVMSFASLIENGKEKQLRSYFSYIFEDYPDMLRVSELAEISGYCKKTIYTHIKLGHIKCIKKDGIYFIPKMYALDFLSSSDYINTGHYTKNFERIWRGFQIWKNAKS